MKIKVDENLPSRLTGALRALGHDADTVPQEGLAGQPDVSVWDAAQKAGRFFITQDLDFSDMRRFAPGTHQGILLVRLRDPGRLALLNRVKAALSSTDPSEWPGCFAVLTETKLRITRPAQSDC